jgi:hypothetical protein
MSRTHITAVLSALAVVAGAGSAIAAVADSPTTVTVGSTTQLVAGDRAPFDAPGVRAIRAGKPVPAGYVLVGRKVDVDRGTNAAGAAIHMFCPGAKRLRTFGVTGNAGFQITSDYVGHRSTVIVSLPDGRRAHTSGTVYAVCR